MYQEIKQCRICGNPHLTPILHLGNQFLTGTFPRDPAENITCGPLELVKCHAASDHCGLVQLRQSYDLHEMYGDNYGYRSGLNRSMVEHLRHTVETLQKIVALGDGDLALDIGSNDGTLLSFYPPILNLVGIDPIAGKFKEFYRSDIQAITDFFSASLFKRHFGEKRAKLITSIAMFYDLEQPLSFMEQISEVLAEDGIWHFEQSYLPSMLQANAYDTICHEHLEYYALKQIKWMTDRAGLKIIKVELNEVNGGSFTVTVAKSGAPYPEATAAIQEILLAEERLGMHLLKPYEAFKQRVFTHRDELLALLSKIKSEGGKVVGYGASTKGNVILQFCGLGTKEIPYMAEVNKDKFGCYTPGSHIPIISEAEAHAMQPDYFLVMPWHFKQNLMQREAEFLSSGGKMIFPLPEIEIIGD